MASIQQTSQGPVLVLKESSLQQKGQDARKNNIYAATLVKELVRSSLGPRGLDKMLVDSSGDVTVTNDGATILKEIDVQHPAAKMLVEVSKATDTEVGDGTVSSVVIAGSLLEKAQELLEKEVHPSIITEGYEQAKEKCLELLDGVAQKVKPDDTETLKKIAKTSMESKLVSVDSDELGALVVDAAVQISKIDQSGNHTVDLDNIKMEKKAGATLQDSQLIKGIALDKEVVHSGMPRQIENAKIAIVNSALEIQKTETSSEIRINDPAKMNQFLEQETQMIKEMVDKVANAGANVLLCQKGIDDIAQHYLAKQGILAVRRIKESDMSKLANATGGRICTSLDELSSEHLGEAQAVREQKVEEDKWVFVEGCKNPSSITMLLRGGSQRVVDEAERSVHDSLMVVKNVIEKPAVVVGGGATEMYLSTKLKEYADTFKGREQIAIQKYAEAIESIPFTIAENAGMDPVDTLATLKSKQSSEGASVGIDAKNMTNTDMSKQNILEPVSVKEQLFKGATESSSMILRIDNIISSSGGGQGGGGQPGGGMPPMG